MGGKAYTGSFARIYDEIMGAVPYDLWYNYLHELLDYYQKNPVSVLDLACGTGNMSLRFAGQGYRVVGLDQSAAMLEIAESKCSNLKNKPEFIESDLRDFELYQKYDLAFSVFDSLNYILSIGDLKKVFENVFKVLNSKGIFIFDMNTLERLMSINPGTSILNGDGYTCFWEDIIDKTRGRWRVKLKIYFNDEASNPYEELHEETAYPTDKIINALAETGFKEIDVFNAYSFSSGRDSDNRLYYIALKESLSHLKKSRLGKKLKWTLKKPFYLFLL